MVSPLLKQLKESGKFNDDDRDHAKQILTNTERPPNPAHFPPLYFHLI